MSRFSFKKKKKRKRIGVLGTNIWKICVLRAEILTKICLKIQNFLKILMVGAHEGRIDGKFREHRLARKKGS